MPESFRKFQNVGLLKSMHSVGNLNHKGEKQITKIKGVQLLDTIAKFAMFFLTQKFTVLKEQPLQASIVPE
jgi:hypothetical protein